MHRDVTHQCLEMSQGCRVVFTISSSVHEACQKVHCPSVIKSRYAWCYLAPFHPDDLVEIGKERDEEIDCLLRYE